MKQDLRPVVNSDLIGDFITIELNGFPGRQTKPEPCRVHYLTMGSGEPLLLVHAIGQSLYTWRELMPILAESYCVVAVDLPGFGFSDRPLSLNYSMDETAEILVKILDALGVQKAHVLGTATGAGYVMHAAAKYPDRFMKAIVLTPGGITEKMPKKLRRLEKPLGPFYREMYAKKDFEKELPGFYYDGTVCTPEVVSQVYKTCEDHASRQAIMYAVRNYDFDYAIETVLKNEREFFVIWGEEDRMNPMENLFRLREKLGKSVYHSIRNTGHFPHEEKAAQVAEAVDRYIRYEGDAQ
jgi:pimeloyl-ACP methyl ester carboxylesterase